MQPGPPPAKAVAQLIRACPDYERRVIVLATQGRTAAEIAQIMGDDEATMLKVMEAIRAPLQVESWDAGIFNTRPVRRVLEQARRHAGFDTKEGTGQ